MTERIETTFKNAPQVCLGWQILPLRWFCIVSSAAAQCVFMMTYWANDLYNSKGRRDGFQYRVCITTSLMWLLKHYIVLVCLHRGGLDKSGKRSHEIITKCPYVNRGRSHTIFNTECTNKVFNPWTSLWIKWMRYVTHIRIDMSMSPTVNHSASYSFVHGSLKSMQSLCLQ